MEMLTVTGFHHGEAIEDDGRRRGRLHQAQVGMEEDKHRPGQPWKWRGISGILRG